MGVLIEWLNSAVDGAAEPGHLRAQEAQAALAVAPRGGERGHATFPR